MVGSRTIFILSEDHEIYIYIYTTITEAYSLYLSQNIDLSQLTQLTPCILAQQPIYMHVCRLHN